MSKLRLFDLFRSWLHDYFKHPLENIRQARPIIPGRLYSNFGNICKAVPMTDEELAFVAAHKFALPLGVLTAVPGASIQFMEDLYSELGDEKEELDTQTGDLNELYKKQKELQRTQLRISFDDGIPSRCNLCDFHKNGIPCPLYNILKDGSTVCDTHKYIIIKHNNSV